MRTTKIGRATIDGKSHSLVYTPNRNGKGGYVSAEASTLGWGAMPKSCEINNKHFTLIDTQKDNEGDLLKAIYRSLSSTIELVVFND